jgi:hypothetical protein
VNLTGASRWPIVLLALSVLVGACVPGLASAEKDLEARRAEIEALAADRSSTSDSECGIVYFASCGCDDDYVVYSRSATDEAMLLEKVQQYNELEESLVRQYHLSCPACDRTAFPSAISVNGVCVAGTR